VLVGLAANQTIILKQWQDCKVASMERKWEALQIVVQEGAKQN